MRILLVSAVLAIALLAADQGARSYIDSQIRAELLLEVADTPLAEIDFSKNGAFDCEIRDDHFPYEYATCMYGHPLTTPKAVDFVYMPPRSILYVLVFGKAHLSAFSGNNALQTYRNVQPHAGWPRPPSP